MKIRVAIGQINVTVGALEENVRRMGEWTNRARRSGADLVIFPEMAVTGYPPEDLLFKRSFVRDNLAAAERLARRTRGITAVAGLADRDGGGRLYNAAAILHNGRWVGRYRKIALPNYGVFDEKRYFTAGEQPLLLRLVPGTRKVPGTDLLMGISICEDIWVEESPCRAETDGGAGILVNISASPYHAGKLKERERLLSRRARQYRSWICYVNLVGGQDELVFDGASLVLDPQGRVRFRAPQFKEGLFLVDLPVAPRRISPATADGREPAGGGRLSVLQIPWRPARRAGKRAVSSRPLPADREIFEALVLGLRDYVRKNGFSHGMVGMSGGIDSNLTAAIAVAALGERSVTAVSMPSRYSSSGTRQDARRAARTLGVGFMEIPIERMFQAALSSLQEAIGRTRPDTTEENLQARIRGTILMALSNKFHWLVLATGNKSELSTGYCTLYGDMVGGFAVIKDLPKTWVYRLARTANRLFRKKVIPDSVIRRAPTAELKPNQRDQDILPPYGILDAVIRAYVEERRPIPEIRRRLKAPGGLVRRVQRMIDANEYKRRQAPVGIKITPLAFGKDRRMPITHAYREES